MRPEDVVALDLPRDLAKLRQGLATMIERGEDPTSVLSALAERNALALADVVVGPRGLSGPGMARAALRVIEPLESVVSPSALYRRLVKLAGSARLDVLKVAARRHPSERWVMQLSAITEGEQAGLTHITLAPPELHSALCAAYAKAGAVDGLVAAARVLRDDVPVLALMRAGNLRGGARAAAALLVVAQHVPVVERMAAIWGPELEPMLSVLIEEAPDATVLERLRDYTPGMPVAEALLSERLAVLG
jgi:hypothetical protein